jgi:hypothetical protein
MIATSPAGATSNTTTTPVTRPPSRPGWKAGPVTAGQRHRPRQPKDPRRASELFCGPLLQAHSQRSAHSS